MTSSPIKIGCAAVMH